MNSFPLTILLALLELCLTPRLCHVDRFPFDRTTISELLSFNRSYRTHVSKGKEVYPDSALVTVIERECDLLHKAWNSLDNAKNETSGINFRRAALRDLLGVIGPEMFADGRMPPHVPMWRFERMGK